MTGSPRPASPRSKSTPTHRWKPCAAMLGKLEVVAVIDGKRVRIRSSDALARA
ncbi:MAG: hypothetical protein HQL43_01145 [Alphaproteobacteria bacterium]|nr:hypothetical protein [Alphaproteobacteria bacterium]